MPRFPLTLCLLCLLAATGSVRAGGGTPKGQGQQDAMRITVGETTLTGPFSTSQTRSGRLFRPLFSIARALGDVVQLDAASRTVRVQRQTGVKADFDSSLSLVRENGAIVLVLSGADDIDFPPQAEALMLPVEITSALLAASM